jgi:Family of unknown function (DUF6325)
MSSEPTSTADEPELGPVDIVVIGFPKGAPMTGEAVPILLDLVDRGIVRVLDVLFVTKGEDGTIAGFDAPGLGEDQIGEFYAFAGATTGLLGDDDLSEAGKVLEPGESAVMIVYENRWAAPFVSAVRRNGGIMLATDRIPVPVLLEALEALDAVEAS